MQGRDSNPSVVDWMEADLNASLQSIKKEVEFKQTKWLDSGQNVELWHSDWKLQSKKNIHG